MNERTEQPKPPSTEELEEWKKFPAAHEKFHRLIAEVERLRGDNAKAAEAFEQLACSFPSIQVDCDNPIAAAQRINAEHERLRKQLAKAGMELTAESEALAKHGDSYGEPYETIARLTAENEQLRKDKERLLRACKSAWVHSHTDGGLPRIVEVELEQAIDAAIQKGQQ